MPEGSRLLISHSGHKRSLWLGMIWEEIRWKGRRDSMAFGGMALLAEGNQRQMLWKKGMLGSFWESSKDFYIAGTE